MKSSNRSEWKCKPNTISECTSEQEKESTKLNVFQSRASARNNAIKKERTTDSLCGKMVCFKKQRIKKQKREKTERCSVL